MLIRQPNRQRLIASLDEAMRLLDSDARCYYYLLYDEYADLMELLRDYRKKLNTTGIRYEIILGNNEGFFESGQVVYGDGTSEPLLFSKAVSGDEIGCFFVHESCYEEKGNYPVRWQHVENGENKELHIYLLTDRVQEIFFTNNSATDIIISGVGESVCMQPGQMERVVNMNYYQPVPSRSKDNSQGVI